VLIIGIDVQSGSARAKWWYLPSVTGFGHPHDALTRGVQKYASPNSDINLDDRDEETCFAATAVTFGPNKKLIKCATEVLRWDRPGSLREEKS